MVVLIDKNLSINISEDFQVAQRGDIFCVGSSLLNTASEERSCFLNPSQMRKVEKKLSASFPLLLFFLPVEAKNVLGS